MELQGSLTEGSPLIVVALQTEAAHFVVDYPVLVTGVGKLRAGIAVTRVLAASPRPSVVVNVGTAGGLYPGLTGTHEVSRVIQHDFDDEGVAELTGRHDGPPLQITQGGPTLATGDRFIAGGVERQRVANLADLVDMEGYAVAAAASHFDLPVRLIKHVSDSADVGSETTWSDGVDQCAREIAQWLHRHL